MQADPQSERPAVTGTLRKVVVSRFGGPEVLQFEQVAYAEPASNDVRVKVEAIGISAYDIMLRAHRFPGNRVPYTPGEDFVGIVDAVGSAVTELQIGQRVGGWTFGDAGGYTEHLCRSADDVVVVPDGLDPALAVALITNYLTAELALHQAIRARAGERILVHGAGGGLGSAILQLGGIAKLELFGTDVPEKHDLVRANGATPIDYQHESIVSHIRKLTGGGVDGVIDLIGGPVQLLRSYRALAPGGRLLMLGMAGTASAGLKIIVPSLVLTAALSVWPGGRRVVYGPGMDNYPSEHPDWYRNTLSRLFDQAMTGEITPDVASRIPLVDVRQAHSLLESGTVAGKLVLVTDAYAQSGFAAAAK